jgi:hypothetical protein
MIEKPDHIIGKQAGNAAVRTVRADDAASPASGGRERTPAPGTMCHPPPPSKGHYYVPAE